MVKKNTTEILQKLRALMQNTKYVPAKLNAYIVPSEDAHNSEYIADCDKRRDFVCGFTGSRGVAVIAENQAAMWTDGRYFLQAEKEMDSNWILMKENVPQTPTVSEWLNNVLPAGGRVGVDPYLVTADYYRDLEKSLKKSGHSLVAPSQNLVDIVWAGERPKEPVGGVFPLALEFSGKSWQDKIGEIRKLMNESKSSALVLSALDEIAWLFNLRGSDIVFNPVFFAYSIVTETSVSLFINEAKVTADIRKHLSTPNNGLNVEIAAYTSFTERFDKCVAATAHKIWLPNNCSYALASRVPDEKRLDKASPIVLMKALKNPVELQGMKNAHIKDAVAHCEFLLWLDNEIKSGKHVTELSASEKFEALRKQQADYFSLSFETISGAGPNGAIIHYRCTPETNSQIKKDELYLVDSGGQYRDGTTDVTRTVCFSEPNAYQKECFTRVLKGHIALATLKLPEGSSGYRLDSVARLALWDVGLEYRHGTGHGVGHFLNVHEGPAGFSYRPSSYMEGIKENMIITIEPGYYEDGKFGIRIESVFALIKAETKYKYQDMKFLTFEPLTLVPIQVRLLDPSLLTEKELKWLNHYHKQCLKTLTPVLEKQGKSNVVTWLKEQCRLLG